MKRKRGGYLFLEVLLAAGIIGIATFAIFATFSSADSRRIEILKSQAFHSIFSARLQKIVDCLTINASSSGIGPYSHTFYLRNGTFTYSGSSIGLDLDFEVEQGFGQRAAYCPPDYPSRPLFLTFSENLSVTWNATVSAWECQYVMTFGNSSDSFSHKFFLFTDE